MRKRIGTLGAVLVAAMLAAGCGRQSFEAAPSPTETVQMQASPGSPLAATLIVADGGTDAYVSLDGTGFASDRIYTAHVADLPSGLDAIFGQTLGDLQGGLTPIPVSADGRVDFEGSFSIRDIDPSWDEFQVLWHPDGNPDVSGNEEVVLRGPVPARLRP